MLQKSRGGGFVDGVVNIPEPQIGLGQRRMQRLAGRHRHQALFVRAAEKKGDPHQFCSFVIPGCTAGADPESRLRHRGVPGWLISLAPRNDIYRATPIRLFSQCISIPQFSLTRARTVSPRVSISWPVASPVLIRKLQCISDPCAPPTRKPRHPAASISFQALWPGGFLKVDPPVFSRIGWAVSRWLCTSFIRARIASGAATVPRKRAEVKMTEGSTPALR